MKSTSYAENVRGLAYATSRGAGEAIFLNTAGDVCEGTGTNVFCVFGGTVVTPPLARGPLAGITREVLLEWCRRSPSAVTPDEAAAADEVFLTSSLRDVQGVRRWDDRDLPAARPVTRRIAGIFADVRRARSTRDPDAGRHRRPPG